MRLAVGVIYGTVFTGSFETALLWLNGSLAIGTGVFKSQGLLHLDTESHTTATAVVTWT